MLSGNTENQITNKKLFITGGAGFLGKHLIARYYDNNEVTVYSRDEAKHYALKHKYPRVNFVVGDIRNYDLLKRASRKHDIGIFAASMKQIDACYYNYEEANQIIVQGAFNSRCVAEENGFTSACFISSDKSRAATTIYGAMKYVAGESFISNSLSSMTNLSTVVYGNIANSTGSIIPVIWDHIKNHTTATLFSSKMTRFLMTVHDAINLIESSLDVTCRGCNVLPLSRSAYIADLFTLYQQKFGLQYVEGTPRPNEKIHELLASEEESRRMTLDPVRKIYLLDPCKELNTVNYMREYSSKDDPMTIYELEEFLEQHEWFQS